MVGSVMVPDAGGGSAASRGPPPCTSGDPKVQEAVQHTIAMTQYNGDPSYVIAEVMNDPSLTQAQKDEYIAALAELASGESNGCGTVTPEQAQKLARAFNDIGTGYAGHTTPELRQQVTDAIAHGVADGRLDSNEIYGLVKDPGSAGARQLLTGIRDGALLSSVADRLVTDARRQGYDINKYQTGPQTLSAAADIANMAAKQGNRGGANSVLAEIERVSKAGPVAGDMTLVQAMMATTAGAGQGQLPERDGFHALAGLLNSTTQNAQNQPAQDRLFAALTRSGSDGYVGGIDQAGSRGSGLNAMGEYFDRNFARLAETDWRKDNTGDFHHGLVKDFMRGVLLDKDYGRVDQTNDAIATEMRRLAEQVGNDKLPDEARENAASTMGTIMGSLETAAADYINSARGSAEDKVAFIRFFTDKLTDKLISKGAGKLPEGTPRDTATKAGGDFVDALWGKLIDHMAAGATAHADARTGGLLNLSQVFRDAMSTFDASLLNAFDLRVELYYDP